MPDKLTLVDASQANSKFWHVIINDTIRVSAQQTMLERVLEFPT